MALSGYNAGPGRVVKWMREFGDPREKDVDPVDWVEMIPFNETRNYVQRVMESLQVYRRRLGATELALSLDSDLKRGPPKPVYISADETETP
jgi:soluble lytic murein transglycosylase